MRVATATACLALALAATISAQTAQSDEQQIRALIANGQAKGTKDRIFWSGAYKRPFVSPEQGEEVPGPFQLSDRTSTRGKITVVRIEVAKSGDLAYEFSNNELTVETKDGKKETRPASILRVWKKEAGEWKIAAQFARPHQP